MAAARRSTGSGVVVALVIFIVLAFVGIGAGIYLFQQYAILKEAVRENQLAFESNIATVFKDQKWDLGREIGAEYGLHYDEQAFRDVAGKLELAAEQEAMVPLLGWKNSGEVKGALQLSAAQAEQPEAYATVAGLLGFYEERYKALTERARSLEQQVANQQQITQDKAAELAKVQSNLMQQINNATTDYKNALAQHRKEFADVKQMYERARDELKQSRDDYQKAQQRWEAMLGEVRKEADGWKELYQNVIRGIKVEEVGLKAAGKVLEVEPLHELVVLEGGDDAGRKVNQKFVVYAEAPGGVRTRKAEVHISKVEKTTCLATIFNQAQQILRGDQFVSNEVWEKLYPPARVAEAPKPAPAPTEAAPPKVTAPPPEVPKPVPAPPVPAPEETKKEEEKPEEEAPKEEEFIFEF